MPVGSDGISASNFGAGSRSQDNNLEKMVASLFLRASACNPAFWNSDIWDSAFGKKKEKKREKRKGRKKFDSLPSKGTAIAFRFICVSLHCGRNLFCHIPPSTIAPNLKGLQSPKLPNSRSHRRGGAIVNRFSPLQVPNHSHYISKRCGTPPVRLNSIVGLCSLMMWRFACSQEGIRNNNDLKSWSLELRCRGHQDANFSSTYTGGSILIRSRTRSGEAANSVQFLLEFAPLIRCCGRPNVQFFFARKPKSEVSLVNRKVSWTESELSLVNRKVSWATKTGFLVKRKPAKKTQKSSQAILCSQRRIKTESLWSRSKMFR